MLREKIEGKWIAAFRRFLTLNGVGPGVPIAIVAESQSRPVLVELAEIAAYDLGADYFTLVLPTPAQSARLWSALQARVMPFSINGRLSKRLKRLMRLLM